MSQKHPSKPSMKDAIFQILSDGLWHGCGDFVHLGLSYRNRINELKQEGVKRGLWRIDSEREDGRSTFRYRMTGHDCYEFCPVKKTIHETAKEISEAKQKKNDAGQGRLF